jgi:hypothetical protein
MDKNQLRAQVAEFNGAYYDKNGMLHNLDGAVGPKANASNLVPIPGVFIGSDGKQHDIHEVLDSLNAKRYLYRFEIAEPGSHYSAGTTFTITPEPGLMFSVSIKSVGTSGEIMELENQFTIKHMASQVPDMSPGMSVTGIISELRLNEEPIVIDDNAGSVHLAQFEYEETAQIEIVDQTYYCKNSKVYLIQNCIFQMS